MRRVKKSIVMSVMWSLISTEHRYFSSLKLMTAMRHAINPDLTINDRLPERSSGWCDSATEFEEKLTLVSFDRGGGRKEEKKTFQRNNNPGAIKVKCKETRRMDFLLLSWGYRKYENPWTTSSSSPWKMDIKATARRLLRMHNARAGESQLWWRECVLPIYPGK